MDCLHCVSGCVRIVTDSDLNINIYSSGRSRAISSTKGDLFKLLFVHLDNHSEIVLQLIWAPSHLDDDDKVKQIKVWPPHFRAEHGWGNLAADALAESGALHIQVAPALAKKVMRFFW